IDLRVDRSLQFVTRLKETAADFVKREEQLARDLRERGFALKRPQEQAREAWEAQSSAQLSKTEARLEEYEQRIRSVHQARGARIHRMYTSGVRDSLQESQRKRERWLGGLQMRHLKTERELPVKLKAEENEYSEFSGALAEQRRALGSLDNQARRGFGGFSSLTRLLRYDTVNEGEQPAGERTRDVKFQALQQQVLGISVQMAAFRRLPVPRIFSYLPLPILGVIGGGAAFRLWWGFGSGAMGLKVAGGFLAVSAIIIAILYRIGLSQARPVGTTIANDLRKAAQLHDTCAATAVAEYQGKY